MYSMKGGDSISVTDDPKLTHLHDQEFRIGVLLDVSDQENTTLATMEIICPHCNQPSREVLEVPADLSAKLWPLVGKRVIVSRIGEKHYAGESSSC